MFAVLEVTAVRLIAAGYRCWRRLWAISFSHALSPPNAGWQRQLRQARVCQSGRRSSSSPMYSPYARSSFLRAQRRRNRGICREIFRATTCTSSIAVALTQPGRATIARSNVTFRARSNVLCGARRGEDWDSSLAYAQPRNVTYTRHSTHIHLNRRTAHLQHIHSLTLFPTLVGIHHMAAATVAILATGQINTSPTRTAVMISHVSSLAVAAMVATLAAGQVNSSPTRTAAMTPHVQARIHRVTTTSHRRS